MPACPRDNQYSTTSTSPALTDPNPSVKHEQAIELLRKIIDKYQENPAFLVEQPKQTDLLVSIAQLTLFPSPNARQVCLNQIMNIGQDLLTDESTTDTSSSIDNCSPSTESSTACSIALSSNVVSNDTEGEFSLDDLAKEYLQNEPTPPSSNEKPNTPSESDETDLSTDNLSRNDSSSSPSTPMTNIVSIPVSPIPLTDSLLIKPSLESILFTNQLSSHAAAADADDVWKDESSSFGQIFCQKIIEHDSTVTKRISTCLLDRLLYERLARMIALLPKQCVQNSVQQITIRPNDSSNRPPRQHNDNRRPQNRPTFQQNSNASYGPPRHPNSQNPRPYYNQQGNQNGYFVDRRYQQSNRYPPYAAEQQYQPRGPPRNNHYNNQYQPPPQQQPQQQQQQQQQQRRRPPAPQSNNQQASNQNQQQRGNSRKGFQGSRPNAPGSGANSNPH